MKFKKEEVSEKNSPKEYCSWEEVELLIKTVADEIRSSNKRYDVILGITNGGIIPARLMARELDINHIQFIPVRNKRLHKEEMPPLFKDKKYLIVDEIYDTGNVFSKVYDMVRGFDCDFAFLIRRFKDNNGDGEAYIGKVLNHNKWIVFPWERRTVF
jgi:hypoxanthine phosphoribosyltransferase